VLRRWLRVSNFEPICGNPEDLPNWSIHLWWATELRRTNLKLVMQVREDVGYVDERNKVSSIAGKSKLKLPSFERCTQNCIPKSTSNVKEFVKLRHRSSLKYIKTMIDNPI